MFDPFFPLGLFFGPFALCLVHYLEVNRPPDQAFPDGKSIALALFSAWGLSYGVLLALFMLIAEGGSLASDRFDRLVWIARVVSVLLVVMTFYDAYRRRKRRNT